VGPFVRRRPLKAPSGLVPHKEAPSVTAQVLGPAEASDEPESLLPREAGAGGTPVSLGYLVRG
jgi:hypothetical protein